MEPKEVLIKALEAVEGAEVPDDLRELAFAKAVDLYAGTAHRTPGEGRPSHYNSPPPPQDETGRGERLGKVAEFFGLPLDQVENYFLEDEDGELTFVGDPRPLGQNTSDQARAASLLLACARQVGGYDTQGTSRALLRSACDSLGLVDSNYSKLFASKKAWFSVSGSGQKTTIKVKPDGRTAAEEKMSELRAG